MSRTIDSTTIGAAAKYYASAFLRPDREVNGQAVEGPSFVMGQFYNFTYLDEFQECEKAMKEWMSASAIKEFDRLAGNVFKPRSEADFHALLKSKLAIDPDGAHIPGCVGTVQVHGARLLGLHAIEVEEAWSLKYRKAAGLGKEHRVLTQKIVPRYWPIYAGEIEERIAGNENLDALPPGTIGAPLSALNTRISNECAILGADAIVDNLDEGAGAAVIQGRTGTQPTDPDTVTSGTNLFTLVCSDPAFGAAADGTPGGLATASAITDDSSADATGTLGYCRASSTADGATPADDHIDGEAGTSGADFNFNTLAIVSGATVSMTSWTVTMPES